MQVIAYLNIRPLELMMLHQTISSITMIAYYFGLFQPTFRSIIEPTRLYSYLSILSLVVGLNTNIIKNRNIVRLISIYVFRKYY